MKGEARNVHMSIDKIRMVDLEVQEKIEEDSTKL
jgi:hypothetical protein